MGRSDTNTEASAVAFRAAANTYDLHCVPWLRQLIEKVKNIVVNSVTKRGDSSFLPQGFARIVIVRLIRSWKATSLLVVVSLSVS